MLLRNAWYLHRSRLVASVLTLIVLGLAVALFLRNNVKPKTRRDNDAGAPPIPLVSTSVGGVVGTVSPPDPSQAFQSEAHQEALLGVVNCARARQGLTPAMLDAGLSMEAARIWTQLRDDPSLALDQVTTGYAFSSLLTFDPVQPPDSCTLGGFDATSLFPMEGGDVIGIAVFPPQMPEGLDGASALILGR